MLEQKLHKVRVDILSLFPGYFAGPLDESMIQQARKKGILEIVLWNIRDYTTGRHRKVDDRCYGGGPGMVLMAEPVVKAIRHVRTPKARVVYLSPQGPILNAAKCRELARNEHLILLCGHYEGIDQRALDLEVDEEISIGDYVLTNGCLPAIVLLDAMCRFVPGVIGHDQAVNEDSFEQGILDCPHYTRPEMLEERAVPEILLSGDHKKIAEWRQQAALEKTRLNRPDLLRRMDS